MIATSHGGAAAAHPRPRSDPAFRLPSQAGEKIAAFLDRNRFDRPTLVLDIDRVAERYGALARGLKGVRIHYAVKANPHPQVIARLVGVGSRFDAASRAEIELCLAQGADPADISFGNTVKRPADIAWAHGLGIDLYAADAVEELAKLAGFAPGARVCLRLLAEHYGALARGLKGARIHYAVKANPHPQVLARLVRLGARFDAASRAEIENCLAQGADPEDISFGNTVKRGADIAWAHGLGIDLFAADAEEELAKLVAFAPGARVCLRLLVEHTQADWPLTRKFGCAPEAALRLIGLAWSLGLRPVGLSFHVGSQTREAAMWRPVLDLVAGVWRDARAAGFALEILDIGGGFPAFYGEPVQDAENYGAEVMVQIRNRIGDQPACIMAGPSCDSADVLYEKRPVQLPLALEAGDKVRILACGAYTATYASVGFNGFPPLDVVCI